MIDFKYHVVSIVAVFLALAVGLVLGTNVLSGDVLDNLKSQTNDLRKQAQELRAQNQQAQGQLSRDQAFIRGIEPMAVAGMLTGRGVVVISLPDAPKEVRDQAAKTLTDAGATVTAQVQLDGSYDDPAKAGALADLLSTLDLPGFDPAPAGDVAARAANALASALVAAPAKPGVSTSGDVTPPPSAAPASGAPASRTPLSTTPASGRPSGSPVAVRSPAPTPSRSPAASIADVATVQPASIEVLEGLAKAGFVKVDAQPTQYASMAVVVGAPAPANPATPTASAQSPLLDLVGALQRAGAQTVVVGPAHSDDAGGLVAQVRGDATLSKTVSAVDDADTPSGLIAMVYALRAQAGGLVGQYGNGQGAHEPLATALPTGAVTNS